VRFDDCKQTACGVERKQVAAQPGEIAVYHGDDLDRGEPAAPECGHCEQCTASFGAVRAFGRKPLRRLGRIDECAANDGQYVRGWE
jgi:hypothetical protein